MKKSIKLEYALVLYRQRKIRIGKASETAGISFWEFMDIIKERKIGILTDEDDLERQLS